MDIKAKTEEIIEKLKNDEALRAEFKAEPIKTAEKLIGVDLPDDQINAVVDAVKAKVNVDNALDAVSKLAGLFSKK